VLFLKTHALAFKLKNKKKKRQDIVSIKKQKDIFSLKKRIKVETVGVRFSMNSSLVKSSQKTPSFERKTVQESDSWTHEKWDTFLVKQSNFWRGLRGNRTAHEPISWRRNNVRPQDVFTRTSIDYAFTKKGGENKHGTPENTFGLMFGKTLLPPSL